MIENIKNFKLPIIMDHDIISKLLGAKENDIVEITKLHPTLGHEIFFRLIKSNNIDDVM